MTNTYILEKKKEPYAWEAVRRWGRIAVHIFFRVSVVLAGVGILGVIAGAEFGPIMLGRRLLMAGILAVMLLAALVGMKVTEMDLPLDGGEWDE